MPNRPGRPLARAATCTTMLLCMAAGAGRVTGQTPPTPLRPVVDTLYGVPVSDPYRWLEADSEEVRTWFRAQGAHARSVLDALPGRAAILERIRAIGAAAAPEVSLPVEAGGSWFYTIRRPGEPVPRLYVRDAWTGEERLIVDPASTGGSGAPGPHRLATFRPSPDGRLVAYGLAPGGSDDVVLRVRDVASGRDVDGPFERNHWYGSPLWSPDGRVLFTGSSTNLGQMRGPLIICATSVFSATVSASRGPATYPCSARLPSVRTRCCSRCSRSTPGPGSPSAV